jgi:MATE family multidrug resistance protein
MTSAAPRLRYRAGSLGELLGLAGPVVLARLGIMVMGLTDSIVVGRYSAEQLGYHALGWTPTGPVLTAAVGLLGGVQVMTSRALGEGRPGRTGAVLRRGLVYAFWIGLASGVALFVMGPPALVALGLDPRLAAGGGRVVRVFALSVPMYVVAVAGIGFLEGLARPTPGMIAMWGANLVNLLFNLVLVPGAFGLPAMGAVGAAWSTFAARLTLLAWVAIYILRMPQARALGVFDRAPPERPAEAEQRRIGYGAGASMFVESGAFAFLNVIAGWLGAVTVAAWAVVLNFAALIFMVPLGLATATSVLVARAYGARDREEVIHAGVLGLLVCAATATLISLIVWPTAPLIARAYATDPVLIGLIGPAIVLSCLFFVADALQVVGAQALRARGDVWIPTWTHIFSYIVVMVPLAWALAHPAGMGITGIVWAVIIASLFAAGLLIARFWMLARQQL